MKSINRKLALMLFSLSTVCSAYGFEGSISQSVRNYNGSGKDVLFEWILSAHNCKIDVKTSANGNKGESILFLDPAANVINTYDPNGKDQKIYVRISSEDISPAPEVKVVMTAEKKKIKGYKCEKWTVTSGKNTYSIWITRDIDFDAAVYKDLLRGSVEIQALARQGVKGFAMLTESASGVNVGEVTKVTPQLFPAETFKMPAGYTLYSPDQDPVFKPGAKK